jgi:hypothetical protein
MKDSDNTGSGETFCTLGKGGRCTLLSFPLECSSPRKALSMIGDCEIWWLGGDIE